MSCNVNVSINRNNIIDVNIGEYVVIFEDAEEYDGEYVVTPKINEEIVLETANKAFKKQLDSLMDSKMLDIAVESRVLEDLMRQEGLLEKK